MRRKTVAFAPGRLLLQQGSALAVLGAAACGAEAVAPPPPPPPAVIYYKPGTIRLGGHHVPTPSECSVPRTVC